MKDGGWRVFFYETLTVAALVCAVLMRRRVFYKNQSFFLRVITWILKVDISRHAGSVWYGHLQKTTGIRRFAYEAALEGVQKIPVGLFNFSAGSILDLDYELIADKYFLESLFNKYEFYGIASRYCDEHTECRGILVADSAFFMSKFMDGSRLRVRLRHVPMFLSYIVTIIAVPVFSRIFIKRHRSDNAERVLENAIVCEVDSHRIYDMFQDIFSNEPDVYYVMQPQYIDEFGRDHISKCGVIKHALSQRSVRTIQRLTWATIRFAIRKFGVCSRYGGALFDLYKNVLNGILISPEMKNCLYATFEHMSTIKSVRNEIIRASGNKSVFVPYNSYAIDHYYAPEYRYNYDILLSPCKILESVYAMQRAVTETVFPVGAYSIHKKFDRDNLMAERVERLKKFKGDSTAITILSCGLQEETMVLEGKIADLAERLLELPDVVILIRMKPVVPLLKFRDFYFERFGGNARVLIDFGEYELFDYVGVADLFLTSISSSAVDVCGQGGRFFSIDFWEDRDFYFWQTAIDGVLLDPASALSVITSWVRDEPAGQRQLHCQRMERLSELISYKFCDFAAYKQNLLACLKPYITTKM